MAGRARSTIINTQLETGACGLMERQPHLEHGGRRSFDICVLSRMQMRLTAKVDQRQNCGYSVLHGCLEISLVEPQKPAGQLP